MAAFCYPCGRRVARHRQALHRPTTRRPYLKSERYSLLHRLCSCETIRLGCLRPFQTIQSMPLQNRVVPDGRIIVSPARGTMMGNRGGVFHTLEQTLARKHWHSKQWICCVLDFKNRRRQLMQPRRYTELFFLDEATALSAGHRPCFECRRAAAPSQH